MNSTSERLRRTQAYILAGGQGQRLFPLTRYRAKPAVPFGSVHRLIDFTLSNCFNSGVRNIRVLTQYQCESIHTHVDALLQRPSSPALRQRSLQCLCAPNGQTYSGTANAVFRNLEASEDRETDLVLVLSGDHVYRMDYRDLVRFHVDTRADVTIAGVECPLYAAPQFGVFDADSDGRVVGFDEKPHTPKPMAGKPSRCLVSMGVYLFNAGLLRTALSEDSRRETSHDFGRDIIPGAVRDNKVSVYNFSEAGTRFGAYWRDIGTVDAYYRANMDLLLRPFGDPYGSASWPLCNLAQLSDYKSSDHNGLIVDSIIPRGVSIGPGCRIIHSVLSPGVRIDASAEVRNSILLHNVHVGQGSRIQRAILDEDVRVKGGADVGYDSGNSADHVITDKGVVVVSRNTSVEPPPILMHRARAAGA